MAVTIVTYAVITLMAHMVIIARTMTRLASTIITVVTHTVKNITMYNSHKPIHWPLFVLGKYKIRRMYGSATRIVITVHDPTVITAKCAGKESTTKTSSKLSWYRIWNNWYNNIVEHKFWRDRVLLQISSRPCNYLPPSYTSKLWKKRFTNIVLYCRILNWIKANEKWLEHQTAKTCSDLE